MQPFHGVVDFGMAFVQITRDLRSFHYEPEMHQRRMQVDRMHCRTESLEFSTTHPSMYTMVDTR